MLAMEYMWLSSLQKKYGLKSDGPLHVSNSPTVINESYRKSDHLTDQMCVLELVIVVFTLRIPIHADY
jgi:hypothetical protein